MMVLSLVYTCVRSTDICVTHICRENSYRYYVTPSNSLNMAFQLPEGDLRIEIEDMSVVSLICATVSSYFTYIHEQRLTF